jgi:hypothetical protein
MLSWLLSSALLQLGPFEAHTGKSGQTVIVTAPRTAAAATVPTLTVNGQAVALTPGPVSPAFWSFALAQKVNPADMLRLSAPAGWAPGAAALDLPVRNSTGQLESPLPTPSMGLGVNISGQPLAPGATYCPVANWARRGGGWAGSQVLATDAAGIPTKLSGTSVWAMVAITPTAYPTGLWTVRYDATDPATSVSLIPYSNAPCVKPRPDLSSPGDGGRGITRVYECSPGGLAVQIAHPKGLPTVANLQVLPPGNAPSSDPLEPEAWVVKSLTIGAGRGPSVLRFMDSCSNWGGQNNAVHPSDIVVDPTRLQWSVGRRYKANITSIRPLDPKVSPTIQTMYGATPWPVAGAWGVACFGGNRWIAEAVCDQPHGLSTVPRALVSLGVNSVQAGGAPRTVPATFASAIWVTGPSTFAFAVYDATTGGRAMGLDAPLAVQGSVTVDPASGGVNLPYCFAANLAKRVGSDLWLSIPVAASDDLVDWIAFAVVPYGVRVVPELGNEDWNYGASFPQSYFALTMSQLLGLGGYPDGWVARRSLEIAARFRSVFAAAGRPASDVIAILPLQFGWAQRNYVPYAISEWKRTGQTFDVISGAPYLSLPAWGSQMSGWNVGQALDLMRAYLTLDPRPRGWYQDIAAAAAQYRAATGAKTELWAYEGGIEQIAPGLYSAWQWSSHPDIADTEKTLWAGAQGAGFARFCYFNFLDAPRANQSLWGLWQSQGQLAGSGDGSDGRFVNRTTSGPSGVAPDPNNVSVRGEAYREWQRDYWLGRPGLGLSFGTTSP